MADKATKPASYPLRLDSELSQWVKERARTGDRSINAEINRMLRKLKEATEQKLAPSEYELGGNPL